MRELKAGVDADKFATSWTFPESLNYSFPFFFYEMLLIHSPDH